MHDITLEAFIDPRASSGPASAFDLSDAKRRDATDGGPAAGRIAGSQSGRGR